MSKTILCMLLFSVISLRTAVAQESPFVVTYTHYMEEPGNLEIETSSTTGVPRNGQQFYSAPYMELEYGVTARWTSEFYLEGQSTPGDSTVFTGWRWENRYKPLDREHWINPVLYLEYEDLNEASRIQKEVEGGGPDLSSRNTLLTRERDHELEGKLILSGDYHDWNISENFIIAKNFSQSEGVEFGYSFGASRPLGRLASGTNCRWCRENFIAGAEMYGGLGSTHSFGVGNTKHYVAPVISWMLNDNSTVRVSTGIGLTRESNPVIIRVGYTYEIQAFGARISHFFGWKP